MPPRKPAPRVADLHQRPAQSARIVAGMNAANGKTQRDQQAAGDDDRQHIGDAGHKVLVRASALPLLLLARLARGLWRGGGMRQGQRLRDDLLAGVNSLFGAGGEQAHACKSAGVHMSVGGNDGGVGQANFLRGEGVLGPHRALGFNLDLVAQILGGLAQRRGGHEGVRDAGGAGGDGHQLDGRLLFRRGQRHRSRARARCVAQDLAGVCDQVAH